MGVLVRAEDLGHVGETVRESLHVIPEHWGDGVRGVAGALGRDACLVPHRARGVHLQARHATIESTEGLGHQAGQHSVSRALGAWTEGWSAHSVDEFLKQVEVAIGVDYRRHLCLRLRHASGQGYVDHGTCPRGVGLVEFDRVRVEALAQDLGVARLAEAGGHPAEFIAQARRPLVVDQGREDLEAAAQPPRTHAHLMDGIGQVAPQHEVREKQPARVLGEIGVHGVAGGSLRRRPGHLGNVGWHGSPWAQRRSRLACRARCRASAEHEFAHAVQQVFVE